MTRIREKSPAIVFALLALSVLVLGANFVRQSEESRSSSWPPSPDDIVNVYWKTMPRTGLKGVEMRENQSLEIYRVPLGKQLVVTDFSFTADTNRGVYEIVESVGGREVARWGNASGRRADYSSVVGMVFGPSSRVDLKYLSGAPAQTRVQFQLTGYLVDEGEKFTQR